jgi:outer membrane protein TolC
MTTEFTIPKTTVFHHGKTILALTMVLLALSALPAAAGLSLTAGAAAKMAAEKNPEIVAARNLVAEAQGRQRRTGRLPNPELETEIAGGQDFEGRVSVGITQRFPLTARLRIERELSSVDVEMARFEVQERQRQIAVAARTACYELVAARASMALARQQTALADAFAKSMGDGISQGFRSGLDGQQAVLAADILRSSEESLRSEEIRAVARLNSLLGRPADAALSVNESLNLPKAIPSSKLVGTRPDLQLAELSVRAGATDVSLAKASRWDDVGIGIFVEGGRFRDEPGGIEPEALIGVQFLVPLPFWQNGAGRVAEKEAAQQRKTQQMDALRFAVRNEALSAYQVMSARYRAAAQVADKLVPAARQQVSDAEGAYWRAELDIQRVFSARERLAEIESAALDARKNYFLSYSEWLGALGESSTQP